MSPLLAESAANWNSESSSHHTGINIGMDAWNGRIKLSQRRECAEQEIIKVQLGKNRAFETRIIYLPTCKILSMHLAASAEYLS